MKKTLATALTTTTLLLLIASAPILAQPPYQGTIWIDPDIITADDPSTFESLTYAGRGNHAVYDRRVLGWITINAYLFDVVWDDGISRRPCTVQRCSGSRRAASTPCVMDLGKLIS